MKKTYQTNNYCQNDNGDHYKDNDHFYIFPPIFSFYSVALSFELLSTCLQ